MPVTSTFVGEKISRVRWLPDQGDSDSLFLAGGSSDNAAHSHSVHPQGHLYSAHTNHVKVWRMQRPRRTRGTFEDGPSQLEEPVQIATFNTAHSIHDLVFTSEKILLAATSAGSVMAFQFSELAESLQPLHEWTGTHFFGSDASRSPCSVTGVSVSPSSREFASTGEDGRVVVQSLTQPTPLRAYGRSTSPAAYAVKYVKQDLIASANASACIEIFSLRDPSDEPVLKMRNEPLASEEGVQSYLCLAVHPSQPHAILSGSSDGVVTFWDTRQPKFPVALTQSHEGPVWDVRFHPTQSDNFFSCSEDGTLLHWNCNPRRNDQAEFTMASDTSNLSITNLVSAASLGINSLDVQNEVVVCGTDNEALMFFSGMLL